MGICPRGTPGLAGLQRLPRGRTSEGHGCKEETFRSTQRARRGPSQPPKAARTCWRAAWAGAPSFSLPAHLDSDRQQPRGPAATENHLVSSSQALRVAGALLPPGAVSPCVCPFLGPVVTRGRALLPRVAAGQGATAERKRLPSLRLGGSRGKGHGAARTPAPRSFFASVGHPACSSPPCTAKPPLSCSGHLIKFQPVTPTKRCMRLP